MWHGNLSSLKYGPTTDRRSGYQRIMIKVRHTHCQLYVCLKRTQSYLMERIYCNKYQWDPKIGNQISVSKMASVRRSDCLIFTIFTLKQLEIIYVVAFTLSSDFKLKCLLPVDWLYSHFNIFSLQSVSFSYFYCSIAY